MRRWFWLAAMGAALLTVASPARAELRFDGEHRENEAAIRGTFAELPARGKDTDVTVREVLPDEWGTVDNSGDPTSVGMYDENGCRLFLKEGERDLEFTFAHEFGHHVYYTSFSRAERRSWNHFWKQHRTEMPPGDPRTSASEAFAECYAANFLKGPWRRHLTSGTRSQIGSYFAAPSARSVSSRTASSSSLSR